MGDFVFIVIVSFIISFIVTYLAMVAGIENQTAVSVIFSIVFFGLIILEYIAKRH